MSGTAGWLSYAPVQVVHEAGDERILHCPECGRPKLYLNVAKERFFCHRCHFKGHAYKLVAAVEGLTYADAKRVLGMGEAEPVAPAALRVAEVELPEGFRPLTDPAVQREAPFWRYLLGRDLAPEVILRYRLGFCSFGFYAGRVVIPITQGDTVVSWVARTVTDEQPKVMTPKGNKQALSLFNIDAIPAGGEAVITEGVFDALRLPGRCVASFGKHLSLHQRGLLHARGIRQLVLAWDRDAYAEALVAANKLQGAFDVRVALLTGKDPGDMDAGEFADCLLAAKPVSPVDGLRAKLAAL